MSRIKSSNTKAELLFRRYIWSQNVRGYRINAKIKGKPDLYFPRKKIAVFIDGCFWHKCPICFARPKSNNEYWDKKIENNVTRDKQVNEQLNSENISVIRFWEHEVNRDISDCYLRLMDVYRNTN